MQGYRMLQRYLSRPATQIPHCSDSDVDDSSCEAEDENFVKVDYPSNIPADTLCDPPLYSPPSRKELAYHTARNIAIDAKDLAQTAAQAVTDTGIPQQATSLATTTASNSLTYIRHHLPSRDQLTTTIRARMKQCWQRRYLWRKQQPPVSSGDYPRRPPSPRSSSIPMISERVDELPRSEWYRRPEEEAKAGFEPALMRAVGEGESVCVGDDCDGREDGMLKDRDREARAGQGRATVCADTATEGEEETEEGVLAEMLRAYGGDVKPVLTGLEQESSEQEGATASRKKSTVRE
ncbi:hypothetical protein H2201_001891 [Coniosporium apollinis]|uniref:Uncharacterized protein n=2 Tax=Coniosporium TaxID=2810619 RepID=A0ABQ9P0F5_9PEZI|nr:hypothetical protein H2199_000525 [Cladosporium sp. JES 115]KAJ9668085.1 hypothetical protein H2201_001891 [Coniosporium apollinis]